MLLRKPFHLSSSPRSPSSFIDIDSLTVSSLPSPSVSPPPVQQDSPNAFSKTNAFFSSPFTSRAPSPHLSPAPPKRNTTLDIRPPNNAPTRSTPARSRTADFFGITSKSRKTNDDTPIPPPPPVEQRRNFLNLELQPGSPSSPATPLTAAPTPSSTTYISGLPLETPDEPTPRPPVYNLKPIHTPKQHPSPPSAPPGTEEDAEVFFSGYASSTSSESGFSADTHNSHPPVEEQPLAPGTIIRSVIPSSRNGSSPRYPRSPVSAVPLSPSTSAGSNTSSSLSVNDVHHPSSASSSQFQTDAPATLRLTQPLGQGTFSSVWVAQDLSPTPLLLKSKRSLRDLRRREAENAMSSDSVLEEAGGRLKSSHTSSSLMRKLRGGVMGTRPGGGAGSGFSTPRPRTPQQHDETLDNVGVMRRANRVGSVGSSSAVVLSDDERPVSPGDSSNSHENWLTVGSFSNGKQSLSRASSVSWQSVSSDGEGQAAAETPLRSLKRTRSSMNRIVAVKLTSRGAIESSAGGGGDQRERDRTRVSFVREVEILKHISHPNITRLLSHLTTRSHHVLVLPYLSGGDLLSLVNGDNWGFLSERVVNRIFTELCKAVGWMHSVGLVHRDIKLENILLTTPLYPIDALSPSQPLHSNVPEPPQPLIQLTDFGLSRFIDPARPLLATRCGSEAYAAPELVIGGGRRGVASSHVLWGVPSDRIVDPPESGYDARETDAWACGIVLYALVGRNLPFGEGPGEPDGVGIGGERKVGRQVSPYQRRAWLMKIATADWKWPIPHPTTDATEIRHDSQLRGAQLLESAGARRIVSRLLVRDPSSRSRISELWDDEWMQGILHSFERTPSIQPFSPVVPMTRETSTDINIMPPTPNLGGSDSGHMLRIHLHEDEELVDEEEEEELDAAIPQNGWLVDKDSIDNIARQEVH